VIVAFLHARQDPKYAEMMVASVRKHMACDIYQLTDIGTEQIAGCTVVRKSWDGDNPMIFKMLHLADLYGDVLALDTDVIVQADLSPVFGLPFDVALTRRDGPIYDPSGKDVTKAMPYNCGVMFSRLPAFWVRCLAWCEGKRVGWYADQLAAAEVGKTANVLTLHCDNFNYTPGSAEEDVSSRLAVHYKGQRKAWMKP
jgi:hypothetical protein